MASLIETTTERDGMDDQHIQSRERKVARLEGTVADQHAEILTLTRENARLTSAEQRLVAEVAELKAHLGLENAVRELVVETITVSSGDGCECRVPFEPYDVVIPEVEVGFVTWRLESLDFGEKEAVYGRQ